MDFTCKKYTLLLRTFLDQDFHFQTFEEFISAPEKKAIILRHDVDKHPDRALKLAKIESGLNIKASYQFKIGRAHV
jgi:hypothetical protein